MRVSFRGVIQKREFLSYYYEGIFVLLYCTITIGYAVAGMG